MKAIILAAGRGSRLGGLSDDNPKCFNEVGGKKLLEWQIAALNSSGIKDIVIVTGYKSKARKNKVLLQSGGNEYSSSIENVNKMMVWSKKVNESHIGIGVIDSDTGNRVIE